MMILLTPLIARLKDERGISLLAPKLAERLQAGVC
jgi:hypothetical protein